MCFVCAVSYVYLRLKYEAGSSKSTKKNDEIQMSAEEVVKKFEFLVKNDDLLNAQKLAKKYLVQDPYHHDLRRLLTKTYLDNNKEYEAISNLLVLVQFYPDEIELYQHLAQLYKNTHQSKR